MTTRWSTGKPLPPLPIWKCLRDNSDAALPVALPAALPPAKNRLDVSMSFSDGTARLVAADDPIVLAALLPALLRALLLVADCGELSAVAFPSADDPPP